MFMKSMSIPLHGRSRLNCVCRWRKGFLSEESPAIHIFDGENVCIHRISPAHASSLLASSKVARIASGVVSTGLKTSGRGSLSSAAIRCEWAATSFKVSGP